MIQLFDYKCNKGLLQIASGFLLQNATLRHLYLKMWQLLQNATIL